MPRVKHCYQFRSATSLEDNQVVYAISGKIEPCDRHLNCSRYTWPLRILDTNRKSGLAALDVASGPCNHTDQSSLSWISGKRWKIREKCQRISIQDRAISTGEIIYSLIWWKRIYKNYTLPNQGILTIMGRSGSLALLTRRKIYVSFLSVNRRRPSLLPLHTFVNRCCIVQWYRPIWIYALSYLRDIERHWEQVNRAYKQTASWTAQVSLKIILSFQL